MASATLLGPGNFPQVLYVPFLLVSRGQCCSVFTANLDRARRPLPIVRWYTFFTNFPPGVRTSRAIWGRALPGKFRFPETNTGIAASGLLGCYTSPGIPFCCSIFRLQQHKTVRQNFCRARVFGVYPFGATAQALTLVPRRHGPGICSG